MPAGPAAGRHRAGRPPVTRVEPPPVTVNILKSPDTSTLPSTVDNESVIPKLMENLPEELTAKQRNAAHILFTEYEDVFSRNEFDIGRTPLVECCIDTGDHRPIRQPLRRQPLKHMDVIDEHVNEMLRHGVIEPAASPWASNVVLVSKKDGSLRFCVDYRAVNAVTYKDAYPLPLIDNCINAMSGSSWFSTLDLRAGYHNIPVAECDRDKTAFVTRRGCWRYTVMPFGLTCSPSVFQRLMDMVLHGLSYEVCLVYLDDIIIYSETFEEHLHRLEAVLQRLRWAKLKLKPSKCHLLQRKVEFLGHTISEAGVEMQSAKIDAIVQWPRPRDIHQLRSFMGLCGYYRRFIAGFADTAAPLHALSSKNATFHWGPEEEQAFVALKHKLTTAPVLGMPENTGQYILDTDASDVGLGAVLSQVQNGEERPIAFASRTLQRPERNYETTKKELLAVVYGLKQFKQYLLGRPIIIRVDHAALSWLKRTA
ncbi:MAG TPA: reverse transcriptase family protein, partial [Methylomicrobium sp.]|nr:reverse transcriptase family protein [Methylomicrobium sp.]